MSSRGAVNADGGLRLRRECFDLHEAALEGPNRDVDGEDSIRRVEQSARSTGAVIASGSLPPKRTRILRVLTSCRSFRATAKGRVEQRKARPEQAFAPR
jgi:hypothetical protein